MDCTLAYHFDSRPLLCLDDGQAALPCHENIWKAKFVEAWRQLFDKSSGKYSLVVFDPPFGSLSDNSREGIAL